MEPQRTCPTCGRKVWRLYKKTETGEVLCAADISPAMTQGTGARLNRKRAGIITLLGDNSA